jgi:ubiquinone biosynthesis protein UbiJ
MYNEIDQLRNQVSAMDELVNHLEQRLIRLERGVADSEMGQALSR